MTTLPETTFAKKPKIFHSRSDRVLKKSFSIQNFSLKKFFWTRRIEFYTQIKFFSESANFSDQSPKTFIKKTPSSETFCFSSQNTSGHTGCFFEGPAEQSRTKFWRLFAQCPKNESRYFCETKIFSQKILPDTISYILKTLPTFFAKTPKNSRSEARIFS